MQISATPVEVASILIPAAWLYVLRAGIAAFCGAGWKFGQLGGKGGMGGGFDIWG